MPITPDVLKKIVARFPYLEKLVSANLRVSKENGVLICKEEIDNEIIITFYQQVQFPKQENIKLKKIPSDTEILALQKSMSNLKTIQVEK